MKYYFAFGSNMNEKRMKDRGINFFKKEKGFVKGYKLVFQQFLLDENKSVFANIIKSPDDIVEGIIYQVDDTINKLDKFEFVGRDYNKKLLDIKSNTGTKKCIVYIGIDSNIGNEKKPKTKYLNHLLEGKQYISKKYLSYLNTFKD